MAEADAVIEPANPGRCEAVEDAGGNLSVESWGQGELGAVESQNTLPSGRVGDRIGIAFDLQAAYFCPGPDGRVNRRGDSRLRSQVDTVAAGRGGQPVEIERIVGDIKQRRRLR